MGLSALQPLRLKPGRDFFMDAVGLPACNVLAVRGTADAKTEAAVYEVGLEEVWAWVWMEV